MGNIWTPYAPGKANNNMFDNFKYLWSVRFANGHVITQHPQDLYSKHDPESAHNPSSFRDFLDYVEKHPDVPIIDFMLFNKEKAYKIVVNTVRPVITYDERNRYGVSTKHYELFRCKRDLTNIRPIYYRQMEMDVMTGKKRCLGFVIGFQGNESNGSNYKKEINVL